MYKIEPTVVQIVNPNVSESTYKTEKYNKIVEMNGTVSFKNALINTMIDIGDPTPMVEKSQQEMKKIAADDKLGRERRGWPTNGTNIV